MQNLNSDDGSSVTKKAKVIHHCNWCKSKFKKYAKYEKHVAKKHPFAAQRKNTVTLHLGEKLWLLDELERYVRILVTGSTADFEKATQALSVDDRMVTIHSEFRERILPQIDKIISSGPQLLRIIDDFQAFLNLGIPWNGGNFCPSLLIDLVWHSAMHYPCVSSV